MESGQAREPEAMGPAPAPSRRALLRRSLAWLRVGVPVCLALGCARLWAKLGATDRAEASELKAVRRLRHGLVRLGPVGIKLGQMLSTRVDVLPRSWRSELQRLQDAVPAEPPETAMALLRGELGDRLGTLLVTVDPVPHAAASMAQVHRGRLFDGTPVAVKIRRPDLAKRIALDGALLKASASLLAWWTGLAADHPGTRLPPGMLRLKALPWQSMARDFAQGLVAQMDFKAEAANADRFRANMAGQPGILAPRPYHELTTSAVLVMGWIDGVKFHDLEGMRRLGVDFRGPVRLGVTCFVQQLLEDGFFHADTHPGNILVTPQGEVAYLDWGLVATFPTSLRLALVGCFLDLVREDWNGLVTGLSGLGMFPPDVDRTRLIPLLKDMVDIQIGRKGTRMLPLGEVLERLMVILEDQPFYLPDTLATLVRTASTMEGMVLETWPEFKFLEVALPAAARLMLAGETPALRRRLITEWMPDGKADLDRLEATLAMAARELPLPVAPWLPEALHWLLAGDGHPLLASLLDAAWPAESDSDGLEAATRLGDVIRYRIDLEGLDLGKLAEALVPWLMTEPGLAWLGDLLGRLAFRAPEDPLLVALLDALARHGPSARLDLVRPTAALAETLLRQPAAWWGSFPDWLGRLARSKAAVAVGTAWLPVLLDAVAGADDAALEALLRGLAESPQSLAPFVEAGVTVLVAQDRTGRGTLAQAGSLLARRSTPVLLLAGRVAARSDVVAALARRGPELAGWSLRALGRP